MRRREFFALLGGAAAMWPNAARTQQPALSVIGFLSSSRLEGQSKTIAAFHQGLGEAGYVEGRNLAIEFRVAEDQMDRLPALAADLVRRQVAVIATTGNFPAALAAKVATQTIPVVFVMGANPVDNGIVASLAQPGGNMTGITTLAGDLFEKCLAFLHEMVPEARTIAYMVNPSNPTFSKNVKRETVAADALGVRVVELNARTPTEIEEAFAALVAQQAGSLFVGPESLFLAQRDLLVALAAQHAIPTAYFHRAFVELGGLMSYSANSIEAYQQAGIYVGRILNGEKPGDLPVLQPTKLELVINLKTTKALGLTVPPSLLARADEVIE